MDFTVRRDPQTLESTAFVEVCPGPYQGRHLRSGSIFVSEDSFEMAGGLVAQHLPTYNPFGPNDVDRLAGVRIIAAWRAAAGLVREVPPDEMAVALALSRKEIPDGVWEQAGEIRQMLLELAAALESFYEDHDVVSVLGV